MGRLNIADDLYGEFEIEGVLEALILSKPVQRLKGIYQGGASFFVNERWNVTRYEHSVGVMLLIRKLGGSLEEQIAGLLHDVSHTAFSHVIDFVFDNQAENYHELIYDDVIARSDIPSIFEEHGYSCADILGDDSRWTLLEQPAPELCADRVDYTLRDMYRYGFIDLAEVHAFLEQVTVINGNMYPKQIAAAEWFVKTYYQEVIGFFLDPLNVYGYDMLAKTIKLALDMQVLTPSDLLGADEEVMHLLRSSEAPEIHELLAQIHRNVNVREDRHDYDLHRKNKLRLIDPSVPCEGGTRRSASSMSAAVKRMCEEAYQKATEGTYVKIISDAIEQ